MIFVDFCRFCAIYEQNLNFYDMKIIDTLKKILTDLTILPDDELSLGEKIWADVTKGLPPFEEQTENERIKQYKQRVCQLTDSEREALIDYLKEELEWYEFEPEDMSDRLCKHLQIKRHFYRRHYEAVAAGEK